MSSLEDPRTEAVSSRRTDSPDYDKATCSEAGRPSALK